MLAVLMASAGGNQRRPGWAESADLLRSAARMQLRPGSSHAPRSVSRAVRLMFAVNTVSLLSGLAGGAVQLAPADAVAGGALWLVGLAVLALIFGGESGPYFSRQQA